MEKSKGKTKARTARGVVEVKHDRQLPRLSRIEGQVRGLQKMIHDERDCLDIAHQISAVIAALRRVQTDIMRDQMAALGKAVVAEKLSPAKRSELADELANLLRRLS